MRVFVIGGGGREHALTKIYSQSKLVDRVFVAPGNGLMDYFNEKVTTVSDIAVLDFAKIINLAKKEKIDLVDVAQDEPLAAGLVDVLEMEKIQAFGPSQKASEIEWNKIWARNFMKKYHLPTPRFVYFSSPKEALGYVEALPEQILYIKAAGLAAGKGAIRAENRKEAKEAIKAMKLFGKSGRKFLVEEEVAGEEFSLFAICSGQDFKILGFAQDHKRVWDGDFGPNTGGMGCVAPTNLMTSSIIQRIEKDILKPVMIGMQKEQRPYKGILYLGGVLTTDQGIKIVEFNARWGDPEAEVILPSLQTDYLTIVKAALHGKLKDLKVTHDSKVRISVAGCAKGYPDSFAKVKSKQVFGLADVIKLPAVTIYGAGIKREDENFVVSGGRVFHLVAEGKDILEARERAYEGLALLSIEGDNLHYRTDIGWRDIKKVFI